jgi:DNA polymerase
MAGKDIAPMATMLPPVLPSESGAVATSSSTIPACSSITRKAGVVLHGGRDMHERLRRSSLLETTSAAVHILHRDYETRSRLNLRKVGAFRYAGDLATEVICASYAVDNGLVKLWWRGNPIPPEWFEAATNPNWRASAHGDQFESAIEEFNLHPRLGWPIIPPERHLCTQTMCLVAGLPARLKTVAIELELVNRKDDGGERLMHQMSKPRRPRKDEDPGQVYFFEDADRLERLGGYCKQDTEVERELHGRLSLSNTELALWIMSNKINARGFHIDRAFALAARQIGRGAAPEIDAELAEITGGAVTGINQVARMRQWLQGQGVPTSKLERETVEEILRREDLPPPVCRVLGLRLNGAQAATKKIDALLARAGADDRVRGAFRHHGASTGRWSAEGFQPQNLKRPVTEDLAAAIADVATGDYQHMKAKYARPLEVVGDCTRSMITAAPGHELIGADFSSIESRGLAWVAGEEWKLDSYRRFDATKDPRDEPYCATACKIFGRPPGSFTKESPERGVGKVCDLAFGYQGGLNAWRNFEPDRFTDAEVERFKIEWRSAHPQTKAFWYAIDNSAVLAMQNPGEVVRCGKIDLKHVGAFLLIRLPSGRKLSYPMPRLITVDGKNGQPKPRVVFKDNSEGRFTDCRGGQGAYGGLWTENIISGLCRDLLAAAMLRVEAAGFPIVLHVHDEIVCEVPIGFSRAEEFARLMTRKPSWATQMPVAASVWRGPRYCK